jgi:hypothetical protein
LPWKSRAKPGERRGGRQKGSPNKQSIPAIKAAIVRAHGPDLDSLSLQRLAAVGVLTEIRKALTSANYKPAELIDWYLKLARIAEGYIGYEHPRVSPVEREDRGDYNVGVHAELSRLNTEQLIALKQLALYFWHTLEPKSRALIEGWPLDPPRASWPSRYWKSLVGAF